MFEAPKIFRPSPSWKAVNYSSLSSFSIYLIGYFHWCKQANECELLNHKTVRRLNGQMASSQSNNSYTHKGGPVRVNSNRRHHSETVTWKSWNDDKQQALAQNYDSDKEKSEIDSDLQRIPAEEILHFTIKLNFPWVLIVYCVTIIRK